MNVFIGMFLFSSVMALGTTTTDIATNYETSSIVFQVIQNQIAFDASTVESATIVAPEGANDTYGVNIKLKASAASKLSQMTGDNIGKRGNFVLNGIVISSSTIQSSIGGEFLVSGLTMEQANQFIESLSTPEK
ncbi:putative protein-export membrane protein secD [Legionella steigerwaltii]|uniref:SecDF P1 head subdomain domain-containing protein n=2 Tax=Legionella steigerwaltii TaxID=460 RepID=A0A378L877_9GAMM|nr:putative protein-export membrane protein secD [Legionella steigerwaltii]STY23036.1 putative protein-export membrane protein secD [Legionella steigerwaltii]